MDITQLRYFLAAAETLNYTKAAKQLYISRQALRQSLTLLEKELETPLFENCRNKLSLTAAGEYLRTAGTEAIEKFDQAAEGVKRFSRQESILTLALSQSLFPFMLPELDMLLKYFQAKYPAFNLKILTVSNDEVIRAVKEGKASCGFMIQMPCVRQGLIMDVLARYEAIVSYRDHTCTDFKPIGLKALEGRLCIGMGSMYETMRPFYETCQREGIEIQYEVVPSAIDAFYRIAHDNAAAFDILKEGPPFYDRENYSILEGYYWEIGILHRENSAQKDREQIFCRFIKEEYLRQKGEVTVHAVPNHSAD